MKHATSAFLLDFQARSKIVLLDYKINVAQNGSWKNNLFSLYLVIA